MTINNFKSLEELSKQDYLVYDDLAESIGRINNPLLHLPLKNNLDMICGDGSVTFTRSTTATYIDRYGVVQDAVVDEARFEEKGLLIEGASTNKCLQSEDLSTTWILYHSGDSVSTNAITAPDGNTTADGLVANTDSSIHCIRQDIPITKNNYYTVSCFFKVGNLNYARMQFVSFDANWVSTGSINQWFHLSDEGTIGTNIMSGIYTFKTASIKKVSNDWYRCSISVWIGDADVTHTRIYLHASEADNDSTYTGDGSTVNVYMWGAQLEEMPFATSYIPTTTAAVTRAKDICKVPVVNNIVSPADSELTILADVDILGRVGPANQAVCVAAYTTNYVLFRAVYYNLTKGRVYLGMGASDFMNNATFNTLYRVGVTNDSDFKYRAFTNGEITGNEYTATGVVDTSDNIYIGCSDINIDQLYGHISNFRIYDIALTEKEMRIA